MSTQKLDIIVFGATGFTGRLITRYLASHPQHTQGLFSFGVAARSQSKLQSLVQELSLPPSVITIQVDVLDESSVEAAVKFARVIINTVGPYWRWGTPVVQACARNGVHYVDLTGEAVWVKDIIDQFDYLATKSGAVIVPSCGYDSIPSDVSAFLSNKTLKAHGSYHAESSVTAHNAKGGISGGTLSTMMTLLENVPRAKLRQSAIDYSLSPITGPQLPRFKFLYNVSAPGESTKNGAFFFMSPYNKKIVQRTHGLLEMHVHDAEKYGSTTAATSAARRERYGPSFTYDEFLSVRSRIKAFTMSTIFLIGFGMIAWVRPIRWLFKRFMPQPGSGPSEEAMRKGFFTATNYTTSNSTPPVHVKSIVKGSGDPGYDLTAVMISESALSLLLPPTSSSTHTKPTTGLPEGLPALAKTGGILTPMSAFGDVLITRLTDTGRFSFESRVLGQQQAGTREGRKTV